ncbi:MAG: response regulator [Myxococcota bacterium]
MLVEDDPLQASSVVRALRRRADVEAVHSLAAAQDAWEKRTYDGVILDIELGADNGLDFAEALRRRGSVTPIVVYSGTPEGTHADRIEAIGAQFVAKGDGSETHAIIDFLVRGDRPVPTRLDRYLRTLKRYRLSNRQQEILRLACEGLEATAIGARLGIYVTTFQAHLTELTKRTGRTLDQHVYEFQNEFERDEEDS